MPKIAVTVIFIVLIVGIVGGGVVLVMRQLGLGTETTEEANTAEKEGNSAFSQLQPAEQAENGIPGRRSALDSDEDGLTDEDESIWGTDPDNPDTDGDGYLDGEEIATNHDPRKPAPNDLLGQETAQAGQPVAAQPGLTVEALESYFADDLNITGGDKNYTEEYNSQYGESLRSPATMSAFAKSQPIITKLPRPGGNQIAETSDDSAALMSQYLLIADDSSALADATLYSKAQYDLQTGNSSTPMLVLGLTVRQYRDKLLDSTVPKSAIPVHTLLLGYTELLGATFNQIAQWNEDPVRSMVATRQLEKIDRLYYPIIYQELQRLQSLAGL